MSSAPQIDDFIARWKDTGGSEHANYQLFVIELTELLGLNRPNPATDDDSNDHYRFERPVTFTHTHKRTTGFIDAYRAGHFVLETKQGVNQKKNRAADLAKGTAARSQKRIGHGVRGTAVWDDTMLKARNQADNYARAVAREDGWPPFLMIVDVGHVIELYADFSKQGQGYNQFPDGNRYRIYLDDLRKDEIRDLLCTIWTDPYSLDPSLKSAEVTRDIAAHLAELGKSFEGQGHVSETVARFLMRCLFSMFAEDVDLIPRGSFTELLRKLRGHPQDAEHALAGLWQAMDKGEYAHALLTKVKKFNGGLFRDPSALPLNELQLNLLIEAAEADWKQVEPAIFGTLLERALDKRQRHKLGAHYTPRAYVQRLVTPTIIEPLREDWRDVQTAVQRLTEDGKTEDALKLVRDFHHKLCETTVLDPACGSGNFLYVALEMMKRLEGEVTSLMIELGDTRPLITVDPHQFLGIELNPWAANVAELVLWIGYLQWHYRTHGTAAPSEPVLRDFKNIRNADAVLEWSDRAPRMDADGNPVTRWDGVTTMNHPVTGEGVPDPTARVQVFDYAKPKATVWPRADFIVGNPPFIGMRKIKAALTPEYVEALRKAYQDVPNTVDFVMYWWAKAAEAIKKRTARRFGLITTNSITQDYSRKLVDNYISGKKPALNLIFATTNHPWVDAADGAAVRIAMTVASVRKAKHPRILEAAGTEAEREVVVQRINSRLADVPDFSDMKALEANFRMCFQGVVPAGDGFKLSDADRLGLCRRLTEKEKSSIKRYYIGKDIIDRPRGQFIIDLFGVDYGQLKSEMPTLHAYLLDRVKPIRDENPRPQYKKLWWIFAEPRPALRNALREIDSFIGTTYTAKHRVFQFCDSNIVPDAMVYAIASDRPEFLACLSSRVHLTWCKGSTGTLEDRPRYNSANTFSPFPFPDLTDDQRTRLRALGEELDTHRKRQQAAHPKLTLTSMYNVLEKLRAGETIEGKDREIYDQGLIGILKDLHDQVDAAVAEAYGWPNYLSDEDILFRLVALNKERAEEEARGHIRWLRPDYQNPEGRQTTKGTQAELDVGPAAKVEKAPWPKTLPDQIAAVREALADMGEATPEQIARRFLRARTTSVQPLLDSLAALGQAEKVEEGRYAA
ncbi:class I SAM-dependent DNA methyltransferase [Marivita hallyeonensis]|uniref:site-specific DNA-methyltransferase (adenine-specific) n=1 Tax=Marivita hallyeonensis TaxID=996342 RepID=A0A1M5XH56_9RHOB|nr:DNA methyltransferase [Marivita hallyeonensis]SHH99089.1 Type II restriction/modification system, DNA methylase subunit YeeA [Marivita hallyeonensis]